MTRWRVGNIEIVRIVDLELALPSDRPVPEWCVPAFAPDRDQVGLAFSAFAVAVGDRRIVVDPWLANDGPRGRSDAAVTAGRLLGALAEAGFPADAVDLVVNTHLDGIGWNTRPDVAGGWVPSFRRARYIWTNAQLDRYRTDERLAPLLAAAVVDGIEPAVEVAPGVTIEDGPGHEPGHAVVSVHDADEEACITGHLFISPLQVADPTIALDDDAAVATRTRTGLLTSLAASGGLLLGPLLGGPGGGRVRADGGKWYLET